MYDIRCGVQKWLHCSIYELLAEVYTEAAGATRDRVVMHLPHNDSSSDHPHSVAMSTILDVFAHPRIVDCIISHAPFAAVCSLRATGRAIKDHVDARLYRHVVVVNRKRTVTETLRGRRPYERLPLLPPRSAAGPLPSPLASTRLVDYFGSMKPLPEFPNATIVRRCTAMPPPRCHTLVDYANLAQNDWPHLHVPSFVKRWILHVTFNHPLQGTRSSFELITPDDDQSYDLVVVFTYNDKRTARNDPSTAGLSPHDPTVFDEFKVAAIRAAAKGSATFVGVERLPPSSMALPPNAQPDAVWQAAAASLLTECDARLKRGSTVNGKKGSEALQHVASRVRFVTFDDWFKSLPGDEKVVAGLPRYRPKGGDYWPGGPRNKDYVDPAFDEAQDWDIDVESDPFVRDLRLDTWMWINGYL